MRTTKTAAKTTRSAAIVAITALALGLSVPAATAAETTQTVNTQVVQGDATQTVLAQKAAKKTIKQMRRALKKANKAKQVAAAQVETHTAAVQTAQEKAAGPAAAFEPAAAQVAAAQAAHTPAKAALDRANYVINNEAALWAAIEAKFDAADAVYKPLRASYDAAVAKTSGLRAQVRDLQTQQSTAWTNQNAAATYVSNLMTNDIPAAQNQYNAALSAESSAYNAKEQARVDFANRKAQWDDTRKRNGSWEGLRNGTWRAVAGLDSAEALLTQRQADYNQSINARQDVEGYLGDLNRRAAAAQAEIQYWNDVAVGLGNQIRAYDAPIAAAQAEADAARVSMDAASKAFDAIYKEADALQLEISNARKTLPVLTAAEKPLAEALTQANAALAAVAPAHEAAQAVVTQATTSLAGSQATLTKAAKKVKVAKKRLKKALRHR